MGEEQARGIYIAYRKAQDQEILRNVDSTVQSMLVGRVSLRHRDARSDERVDGVMHVTPALGLCRLGNVSHTRTHDALLRHRVRSRSALPRMQVDP